MATIEALDSLSQTIALLTNEKKKYKYFNLNTAQTESLLDYLKRVHNRFNIFLDKHDEAVREISLKINSIMNTLDEGI
jgi:formiminotetrahydrofolate cyclodeaminase